MEVHQRNMSHVIEWRRGQCCDAVGVCQRDQLISLDFV